MNKALIFAFTLMNFNLNNVFASNPKFLEHLNQRVKTINEKRAKAKVTTIKQFEDQVKKENNTFLQKVKKSSDQKTFEAVTKEFAYTDSLTDKELDELYRKKVAPAVVGPKDASVISANDQIMLNSLNSTFSDVIKSKTQNHKTRLALDGKVNGNANGNENRKIVNTSNRANDVSKPNSKSNEAPALLGEAKTNSSIGSNSTNALESNQDKSGSPVVLAKNGAADKDQEAIKEALKNKKSGSSLLRKNEQDSLFETITKTYLNNYDRLIKKDDLEQ